MTIKVYGSSCASTRKARKWLKAHDIPYVYKDITRKPITVEEIQHILRLTEEGTKDIISTRSNVYKQLDINLDTIPMKELYKLIQEHPRLLRHPIIFDENRLQIGYDEHNIRQFIPKEERKKQLFNSIFTLNQTPHMEGI
mgnify:CR=1 FL=1